MCRSCAVPGCQVLLTTDAPMCTRHWARVGATERVSLAAGPLDPNYAMALSIAIEHAQKRNQNMGRTGSYPAGPNIA